MTDMNRAIGVRKCCSDCICFAQEYFKRSPRGICGCRCITRAGRVDVDRADGDGCVGSHCMIERPNEPSFSAKKHLSAEALEIAFQAYQSKNTGELCLIVLRCDDGSRLTPERISVSVDRGVHGDRWERDPKRKKEEQIAIMDIGVAKIFANGQSLTLFGDNLFFEQDWSSWKVGDVFALGTARFVVTDEPHRGCAKFSRRFGKAALKKTVKDEHKKRRGIYIRVLQDGVIQRGDVMERIG